MKQQNFSNHARFVPGFHLLTSALILFLLILAIVNLVEVAGDPHWMIAGLFPLGVVVALGLLFFYTRQFPNKVQDRAIRAEENLRHYVLTGKLLDQHLSVAQIIALRFASDAEFVALASRAAAENMSPDEIKKTVQNWRADHHRA